MIPEDLEPYKFIMDSGRESKAPPCLNDYWQNGFWEMDCYFSSHISTGNTPSISTWQHSFPNPVKKFKVIQWSHIKEEKEKDV